MTPKPKPTPKINWTVYEIDIQTQALITAESLQSRYSKLQIVKTKSQFDLSNLGSSGDGSNLKAIIELTQLNAEQKTLKAILAKSNNATPLQLKRIIEIEQKLAEAGALILQDPATLKSLMAYNPEDEKEIGELRLDIIEQEIALYDLVIQGLKPEFQDIAKETYNRRDSKQRLKTITNFLNEPENFASEDLKELWNGLKLVPKPTLLSV